MTEEQRNRIAKRIVKKCFNLLDSKGKDYSSKEDSLANFKRNAKRLGLSKYQVWAIYWGKHVDSIFNSIKANPIFPQVESEPLEERIVDIINYTLILQALLEEDMVSMEKTTNVFHRFISLFKKFSIYLKSRFI